LLKDTLALRVPLQQLQDTLVLDASGIQFRVVGSFHGDRFDVDIAQDFGDMQFTFANIFACDQQVITVEVKITTAE
jgi:hypothetical protein